MSDVVFQYVTAPDKETAAQIAKALVSEKLAACVNINQPMESIYEWRGKLEQETEVSMLVKTTSDKAVQCQSRIVDLHPYETPCVAALLVDEKASHEPFLQWIKKQTTA